MDAWPSKFTNETYRAARPVEQVNYEDVIGHNNWPNDRTVAANSFVGKMRARTGIATFNLPTEAQWECACRSGSTESYISGLKFRYAKTVVKPESELDYNEDDEIGILTHTFRHVTANLKSYITDLNDLAYADALTSLRNKGAFDICVKEIQTQLDAPEDGPAFAVCIFDCNNLKKVNDQNGHDKGDIYLKETAEIICEVYEHSPVFRIGGDEFAALLMDRDYQNRDELLRLFDEKCLEKRRQNSDAWEQVDVARGMAVYDPNEDESVSDVVRRADKIMYENKWESKRQTATE
jgi:diguanylate cyclase (GGDEF)-like protein